MTAVNKPAQEVMHTKSSVSRCGDTIARVIDEYSGYVQTVVRNLLGDRLPARDIEETVADVFVAYWKNTGDYDESRPLRPYLAGIARHLALNRLRSIRPAEELPEDAADTLDLTRAVERQERQQIVREALLTLSAEDRIIFERYYFYGLPVRRIAAQLGLSESNVKIRLHRGRQALKTILTERGLCHEDIDP